MSDVSSIELNANLTRKKMVDINIHFNRISSIIGQRGQEYGDLKENFNRVKTIASTILEKDISNYEIAVIMASIKLARIANDKTKQDSWDDCIAYVLFASMFKDE